MVFLVAVALLALWAPVWAAWSFASDRGYGWLGHAAMSVVGILALLAWVVFLLNIPMRH